MNHQPQSDREPSSPSPLKYVEWNNRHPRPPPPPDSRPPLSHTPPLPTLAKVTHRLLHLYRTCNPHLTLPPRRCLTHPNIPVHNNGYDNHCHDYILFVQDSLSDDQGNHYLVLDLLGTGTFGQVVKCKLSTTGQIVAVKVIKNQPAYFNQAWVEINILRMLHWNNPDDDTRHIVKIFTHFIFRGHLCLVFERLGVNLYEFLKHNNYVGLDLATLRHILVQLLTTLNVLVHSDVIHCDLKPENILLTTIHPHHVKIIDFGSACQLHYPVYSYVQSRFYRSPEVLLGAGPYGPQIDMWSLGCVAAELFLGIPLFPGQNEMNMISRIVEMLGPMPDRFLRRCRHTTRFFNSPPPTADHTPHDMHLFRLKTVAQYEHENNISLPAWRRFFKQRTLRDIVLSFSHSTRPPDPPQRALRECFVDLLLGMLRVDPNERWTPAEALEHPFVRGLPLDAGQPWCPPARQMRPVRSRPVVIKRPDAEPPTPVDEFYSASAPNFTSTGHLNVNTTWGTGAGGKPAIVRTTNGMFQFHQQYQHHLPRLDGATGHRHGEHAIAIEDASAADKLAFAPSSYVPSSSRYVANSKGRQRSLVHWAAGLPPSNVGSSSLDSRALPPRELALHHIGGARVGHPASRNCAVPRREEELLMELQAGVFQHGWHADTSESRELPAVSPRVSGNAMLNSRVSQPREAAEDEFLQFRSEDEPGIPSFQGSPSAAGVSKQWPLRQMSLETQVQHSRSKVGGRIPAALPPPGPPASHPRSSASLWTLSNIQRQGRRAQSEHSEGNVDNSDRFSCAGGMEGNEAEAGERVAYSPGKGERISSANQASATQREGASVDHGPTTD